MHRYVRYVNIGRGNTTYVGVIQQHSADVGLCTCTRIRAYARTVHARALRAMAGALQRQEVQGCDWSGWAHEVQREFVLAGLLGNRHAWHSGERPRRSGVHGAPLQNVSLSCLGCHICAP